MMSQTDEEILAEMVRKFEQRTGKKAVVFVDRKSDMETFEQPKARPELKDETR